MYGISDENANIENLRALSATASMNYEARICEMREYIGETIARLTEEYGTLDNIYELLSILSDEELCFIGETHNEPLLVNEDRLRRFSECVYLTDRALIPELILEALASVGLSATESDFLEEGVGSEIIAYVKNPLADEAYEVFASELSDPRAVYCDSFKEAIRAVADGRCGYCILPLEESGGVRLQSISELLYKSDLKINSVTPVFGFDGSADMKYALVSRGFRIDSDSEDDRYLEIRLPVDSEPSLDELLRAARSLGHSTYRVNTLTAREPDGEESYYSVVFRDGGDGFCGLLIYLTLFSDSYTAVGVYTNLE